MWCIVCMYCNVLYVCNCNVCMCLSTRVQYATANKRVILPYPPPQSEVTVVPDDNVHGQWPHGRSLSLGTAFCCTWLWTSTYLLTPRCRVLLEKLTGLQLVKKIPAFYGIWRFITAFTSVRHLSLSWANPIQSTYPHSTSWRSILILSTHLCLGLPRKGIRYHHFGHYYDVFLLYNIFYYTTT